MLFFKEEAMPRKKVLNYNMDDLKQKKLLTIPETMFYLRVSEPTLNKISKTDITFSARLDLLGRVFFNREAIDKWIDAQASK